MSGNKSKLIAFNYFGGKFSWVDYLIKYFPKHEHFIDVFAGSLAVTLNKKPSKIETVNDINSEVVNFFEVLRNNSAELIELLQLTPVSREEYNICWNQSKDDSNIERARKFYVRVRQSFFGLGIQRKNKGWNMALKQSGAQGGETVSKWKNALEKLPHVVDRLKLLQIENRDWRVVIESMDYTGAFFYCDPPYPHECRTGKNDYKYEFQNSDHKDLAEVLHKIKGKAMISSYDCPLMRDLYSDWFMISFPSKKNNIRSTSVQECIWTNYNSKNINGQLSIAL